MVCTVEEIEYLNEVKRKEMEERGATEGNEYAPLTVPNLCTCKYGQNKPRSVFRRLGLRLNLLLETL